MVNWLTLAVYVGNAAVLSTYFCFTLGRCQGTSFHAANALAAPFAVTYLILAGAWAALPLPLVFGIMGLYGWITAEQPDEPDEPNPFGFMPPGSDENA